MKVRWNMEAETKYNATFDIMSPGPSLRAVNPTSECRNIALDDQRGMLAMASILERGSRFITSGLSVVASWFRLSILNWFTLPCRTVEPYKSMYSQEP